MNHVIDIKQARRERIRRILAEPWAHGMEGSQPAMCPGRSVDTPMVSTVQPVQRYMAR
jgi:hypothetical protein